METNDLKALACTIERGGFSGERFFTIDGIGHNGIASRSHMWKQDGSPLDEGEPPLGAVIHGFIAVRIIDQRPNDRVLVSVPDGEVIEVSVEQLQNRPARVRHHVPV